MNARGEIKKQDISSQLKKTEKKEAMKLASHLRVNYNDQHQ